MQDMAELERRIAAALHRIGEGIETLTSAATAAPSALPSQDHAADAERIQHLQEALSAERHTVAALREQLEAQAAQAPAPALESNAAPDEDRAELLNRIEKMTAQLDVQGPSCERGSQMPPEERLACITKTSCSCDNAHLIEQQRQVPEFVFRSFC